MICLRQNIPLVFWHKQIIVKLYQGYSLATILIAKLYWGYVLATNFVCQKIPRYICAWWNMFACYTASCTDLFLTAIGVIWC